MQQRSNDLEQEITLQKEKIDLLNQKRKDIEDTISNYQSKILKLSKRIFGKKKAQDEILKLNTEINELNKQSPSLVEQIKEIEKMISTISDDRFNVMMSIDKLNQKNHALRNV